jgi:hypothetical protein
MSLLSFSTSERKDAEMLVAWATSASERLRARLAWRRWAPTVVGALLSISAFTKTS